MVCYNINLRSGGLPPAGKASRCENTYIETVFFE